MSFSYVFVHGTGQNMGAVKIQDEVIKIQECSPITIQIFKKTDHECINYTSTQSGLSLQKSLSYRNACKEI